MSSVKRVNGDYTILTINPGDTIAMQSTTVNIIGDLTVTGNASLTGNIAGDKIYNGTTSIEIQTVNGNANVSVGGTSNVLVVANTGTFTTGLASVTGNVQGGNLRTAGEVVATGNITGGNVASLGNVLIQRDASAGTPVLRFEDTDTIIADGQVFGGVEWYTNDASPGPRVTSAIRSTASGLLGNALVQIFTSTNGAAATAKVTVDNVGNVGIANAAPLDTLAVTGTVYGSSTISAVGNITGGNLLTAGSITSTGNVQAGNLRTAGLASVTGNIQGGNIISLGAVSAGAAGVSATGNITGGNVNSLGILSVTSNIIGGNVVSATTVSMTGNVNCANAAITNTVSAANVSVSSNLTGGGIAVPNYVVLSTPAAISSPTPVTIGTLQFDAVANQRYAFEAYIPLVPDGSMTVAPAVNFSAGTCNYTTQQQLTTTGAFSVASKTTSDDVATTYASTGTTVRTLRISGSFFHTANVTVAMRFQNSTGTITAQTGSYLVYTRVA
jgi:filamentous hemagglutinin